MAITQRKNWLIVLKMRFLAFCHPPLSIFDRKLVSYFFEKSANFHEKIAKKLTFLDFQTGGWGPRPPSPLHAHVWSEYGTQAMKQKNLLWFNISIFSAIFCLIQRISSFSFCALFCLLDEWHFDLLLMIYQVYHIMTLYISIICIILLFCSLCLAHLCF